MTHIEKQNIIQIINNISLEHSQLMDLVLEYSEIYLKEYNKKLSSFLNNSNFLQQSTLCVREAIVLSVHGMILNETIDFNDIIDGCVNQEAQNHHISLIQPNPIQKKEIILFWNGLRKYIFIESFKSNKDLSVYSEINQDILTTRYEAFITRF